MHRGIQATVVTSLVVLLALVSLQGQAQADMRDRPPVEFPDVELEQPLGHQGSGAELTLAAEVGCLEYDASGGSSRATFQVPHTPSGVVTRLQPSVVQWRHGPGQCQSQGAMHIETRLRIQGTGSVGAYEPFTFPVDLFLDRERGDGTHRSYGPYIANVTVTAAYDGHFTARAQDSLKTVEPGTLETYELTINNRGNGETLYTPRVIDPPTGVEVTYRPTSLRLDPGATGTITLHLDVSHSNPVTERIVEIGTLVEGVPTHPAARPVANTTEVWTTARVKGPLALPGPAAALVPALLGAAALLSTKRALAGPRRRG